MEGLTPRQEQVLEFIRESVRANGYPPTVREICAALDLSSPSTVHAHLANLERLGLIKRDPTKPRALDVVQDLRPRRPLPLVGRVAAGQPILAEENIEELRRRAGLPAPRRRRLRASRAGRFHGRGRHLQRRLHRRAPAGRGAERRDRRGAGRRRGRPPSASTTRAAPSACSPRTRLYEPIIVNADEVDLVGRVVGVLRQL